MTANFHEPAPLKKVLACLAERTKSDILVDHRALAAAGTSDGVEATLTAERQPLKAALGDLLRPLGLTYRTFGAETIQVTSNEAAEERLELEFYPVASWLTRNVTGAVLMDRLKARIAPLTWSDTGGPADACFDAPSRCLIVLQSQPPTRHRAAVGQSAGQEGQGGGGKGE